MGLDIGNCENLGYDDLLTKIITQMEQGYEDKMSKVGTEQRAQIERIIYLQVLDNSWREHLYTMDNLKTGIGLRGYNQKDPLVEYKKESYNLLLEFVENLKFETTKMLQIIQLKEKEEEEVNKNSPKPQHPRCFKICKKSLKRICKMLAQMQILVLHLR